MTTLEQVSRFYISFANDSEFLGGTVVEASSAEDALTEATRRGLNPGGQAAVLLIPQEVEKDAEMSALFNTLRTADEMLAFGAEKVINLDIQEKAAFEDQASVVCDDCN